LSFDATDSATREPCGARLRRSAGRLRTSIGPRGRCRADRLRPRRKHLRRFAGRNGTAQARRRFEHRLRVRVLRSELVAERRSDRLPKGARGSIVELWLRRSDGSGARKLPVHAEYVYDPVSWSPDGRSLSFARIEFLSGTPWIFRATLNGIEKRLTKSPAEPSAHADRTPAWSPRGDVVAFARANEYVQGARETIHLVRVDGHGALVRVTVGGEPDWSPDGGRLAFVRGGDVYTITRDDSGLRRVTHTRAKESSPEWSPGGTVIAFVRNEAVWVTDAIGTNERRVIPRVTGAIDWQQH
jgi:hypothetical protein